MSGRSPRWIKEIRKTPPPVLVAYSGDFSYSKAYITIDGVTYDEAGSQTVPCGTVIGIRVGAKSNSYKSRCYVTLDGEQVQRGAGTYEYTVEKNSEVVFHVGSNNNYYYCNITTS